MALGAVFAIGRVGDAAKLPEALRIREMPSDRMPLKELVFEGHMSRMVSNGMAAS
jgi:hypothetical protein